MTEKWKNLYRFFLSIVRWDELLIGSLLLLLGQAFNKFYGFRFDASIFLNLVIWFFFINTSSSFLDVVLSGDAEKTLPIDSTSTKPSGNLRLIFIQVIWVFSILMAAMSFIPLIRIQDSVGFNHLSIMILSLFYFINFIFFLEPAQRMLGGMREFAYALKNAFLLPALSFSIQQDFLKSALILAAFPVFLQLILLKASENLEYYLEGKKTPVDSLVARLGSPSTLKMITGLAIISGLTLFLETGISGFWYKVIILVLECLTASLYFRSIVRQTPNWEYAYRLTRLLSIMIPTLMIVVVWPF
mgnify:CR=1 FL=1